MTDKPTITQEIVICEAGDYSDFESIGIVILQDDRRICVFHHKEDAVDWVRCKSAVSELQTEVGRMQSTLRDICIHSNSDWAQVSSNPAAAIEKIHAIAINAYYGKDAIAQKEPVE